MTKHLSNTRKRTAESAFNGENTAGDLSSHQSTVAPVDASATLPSPPPIADVPPLSRFVAGSSAQLGGQQTATCLGLFTSPSETADENGPPRPLKRRKAHSSSDSGSTSTNNAESYPNETFGFPPASFLPNGPTWSAGQDVLSTFEQDPSISSPTMAPHTPSSKDTRSDVVTIEPSLAPTTTKITQGGDFVVAVGLQSIVSPLPLHSQPQPTPIPRSPYPEYSDEEWGRLSRHRHLLRNANSEAAAHAREKYARHKEGGFQINKNYGLRKFRRNIPSRFAREAVPHADPANALGAQRLPVNPAQNIGHVGWSQSSQLNLWRRKVTKAKGQKYGKRKSRWAFFPTITGKRACKVKGDYYRVNILLLNFGCWLRDETLWETVKSSDSLKPVEEWWEANKLSGGFDTATECGDECEDEDEEGWRSMEEEEDEEELPEEEEEKGH